jgi:hypothetical protein
MQCLGKHLTGTKIMSEVNRLLILLLILFSSQVKCQNWVAVSGGLDQIPNNLFSDSVTDKLYVSGNFRHAGGHQANGVAAWDGQSWDTLNGGMDGQSVRFTVRYHGTLYCFGYFQRSNGPNGIYTNGIASWNGSSWDSINNGFDPIGPVSCFINNNLLYITGGFATADNIASSSAVIWDGTSFISIGIPHAAIDGGGPCAFYNGMFYMIGAFADSSYSLYHFAYWNGSQWNQVSTTVDGYFLSMAVYHNELYLSGWGITGPGQHIIKYDGTNFTGVGGDLSAYALKLKVIDDKLFAVGVFNYAGGLACPSHIATWDGAAWVPFTNDTFSGGLSDIEVFRNELYVCGAFGTINSDSIFEIAKYTGPLNVKDFTKPTIGFNITSNPANASITISFSSPLVDDSKFIVRDVCGREQLSFFLPRKALRMELDISNLSSGIYFLTLVTSVGSVTRKFIKE